MPQTCSSCNASFVTLPELWSHLHSPGVPYNVATMRQNLSNPKFYETCPAAIRRREKVKEIEKDKKPLKGASDEEEGGPPKAGGVVQCLLPFGGGMSAGNLQEKLKEMLEDNKKWQALQEREGEISVMERPPVHKEDEIVRSTPKKRVTKPHPFELATTHRWRGQKVFSAEEPLKKGSTDRAMERANLRGQERKLFRQEWALVPGMPTVMYVRM